MNDFSVDQCVQYISVHSFNLLYSVSPVTLLCEVPWAGRVHDYSEVGLAEMCTRVSSFVLKVNFRILVSDLEPELGR